MKAIAWTGNQNHRFSLTIYRSGITSPIPVYAWDLGLIVVSFPPPPPSSHHKSLFRGGALLLAIAPLFIKESRSEKKKEVVGWMKGNEKNTRERTTQTVCSTLRSPMLSTDSYLDANANVSSLGSPLDLEGIS